MDELRGVGLHQLHASAQGIGHIDHVHIDVARNGTGEVPAANSLVVDLHGIVGRTATGQRDVRDDAREAHRTRINAVLVMVIVAQQFTRNLADAIDGRRLHNGVLRSLVLGRRGTEGSDRRGGEEGTMVLAGHFKGVVQRAHIDIPGHLGIALADSREQRHEVEDGINVVTGHDRGHGRSIEGIQHLEGSILAQIAAFAHIGGHDIRAAINPAQKDCQLGTNLASGTYYQNTFHRV